jgi:hypothetical protein
MSEDIQKSHLCPRWLVLCFANEEISAKGFGEVIMAGVKRSGDKEVDAEVYNKTLEERTNKWVSGPIQWEALPEHAVVNRRFGFRQGTKVRLIDDFSGSGVNATLMFD